MNTVEPIRDRVKIEAIKSYLKGRNTRDWLLFVLGINTGLRISDLLNLRVKDVVDEKGKIQENIIIREQKTGKEKKFSINKNARKALGEFLRASEGYDIGQPLFVSQKGSGAPLGRTQAWKILNRAARAVGVADPIGTHTLRKTFGYHAYQQGTDVTLLQKVFNHSAPSITLRYIGITQDDIDSVYLNLNL
jgi:integrase